MLNEGLLPVSAAFRVIVGKDMGFKEAKEIQEASLVEPSSSGRVHVGCLIQMW